MADLAVDERTLTSVAWRVSTAAVDAEVSAALAAGSAADVGSPTVAAVLDEATGQLVRRAELTVEAIRAVGDFPTIFLLEFAEVEARLAAGLPLGDLAGVGSE
ncbi:hypothetical protein ABID81_001927 [Frigoribacterium sp. PvP054]|uniref:hypothetical protein n=1 Tax=Frigoribacterium sp. PvP054 TaxID=3156438 RepID=UPI0033956A43